jgi:hypothetical protein
VFSSVVISGKDTVDESGFVKATIGFAKKIEIRVVSAESIPSQDEKIEFIPPAAFEDLGSILDGISKGTSRYYVPKSRATQLFSASRASMALSDYVSSIPSIVAAPQTTCSQAEDRGANLAVANAKVDNELALLSALETESLPLRSIISAHSPLMSANKLCTIDPKSLNIPANLPDAGAAEDGRSSLEQQTVNARLLRSARTCDLVGAQEALDAGRTSLNGSLCMLMKQNDQYSV